MREECKSCNPTFLEDPEALFREIDRRGLLIAGPDLVVVVRNEGEVLLGASEVHEAFTEDSFNDDLTRALEDAGAEPWTRRAPTKTAYLIRRRLGRAVPLPSDVLGLNAWLNAKASLDVYSGEWFLVTDHGWRRLWGHEGPAGAEPRLRAVPRLRVA
jgi:hypothetical protein